MPHKWRVSVARVSTSYWLGPACNVRSFRPATLSGNVIFFDVLRTMGLLHFVDESLRESHLRGGNKGNCVSFPLLIPFLPRRYFLCSSWISFRATFTRFLLRREFARSRKRNFHWPKILEASWNVFFLPLFHRKILIVALCRVIIFP